MQGVEIPRSAAISCFNASFSKDCPQTYKEAISGPDQEEWKKAINREMDSIKAAETFVVKELPSNRKTIKSRWVFTKKYDKDGNVSKYKARWVPKGFTQKYGIDYVETFAPVAKLKSIRTLITIAAKLKLSAFQDDVPTAFLKGNLKEEIWIEQPRGYEIGDASINKGLLRKTLYGLKQSPREWNSVLHSYLMNEGLQQSQADSCVYVKRDGKNVLFVGVYVDDIITVGEGAYLNAFRNKLRSHFKMTEGGVLEWYLGISFQQHFDKSFT